MSGSYTAFEVEAERRRELVESAIREAAERRALQGTNRAPRGTDEVAPSRSLAEAAASLLNRAGQRA